MLNPKEPEVCIGVDFGTSNSCCGVFINGAVKIAPNKIGERITPSVLLLERNEIEKKDDLIVGEQTLCKNITNLKNYIYEIKRFMGLSYEEFEASGFKNSLNYEVGNKDGTPVIKMEYDGQMRDFTVEEISSHIIKNIIQNAEDFISLIHDKQGLKITNAVFTIPTQFTEKQKNSIIAAAKLAGIKVPRVIYEPTAAALAYGIGHDLISCEEAKKISKRNLFSSTILGDDYTVAPSANEAIKFEETVMAFDLGGGTLDLTLLKIKKDKDNKIEFDVKLTEGDIHLGGSDFDKELIDYCIKYFCEENEIDKKVILNDFKAMRRLKIKCEGAKKLLSIKNEVIIQIDNLYDNNDLVIKIRQKEFERICKQLYTRIKNKVEFVLNEEDISADKIDKVILVGGATRMCGIKELLISMFGEKKIKDDINPDEAVAIGATLEAAKMQIKDKMNFNLTDITPYNIGIPTKDSNKNNPDKEGVMYTIIKKYSKIPCNNEETFEVDLSDDFPALIVKVYEGNRKYIRENSKLGEFILDNLGQKGLFEYIIGLNIDVNGKLSGYIRSDQINILKNKREITFTKENKIALAAGKRLKIKKNGFLGPLANLADRIMKVKNIIKVSTDPTQKQKHLVECCKIYEELLNEYKKFKINDENGKDKNSSTYNEYLYEKIFSYSKELFNLYLDRLLIPKDDKEDIIKKIKQRMNDLIEEPNYADYLLTIFKDLKATNKNEFYVIFNNYMEIMDKKASEYLSPPKISRYYSKSYLEKIFFSIKKFVIDNDLTTIDKDIKDVYDRLKKETDEKLKKINSFAIYVDTFIRDGKFLFGNTGFTRIVDKLNRINDNPSEKETNEILDIFLNMLDSYDKNKKVAGEAYCLANIIKIYYCFLNKRDFDILGGYIERLKTIKETIDGDYPWYNEIEYIIEQYNNKGN